MMADVSEILVSIPNGLPRPFSLQNTLYLDKCFCVSIPNGLPTPFIPKYILSPDEILFEFQSRTGSPGHLASEAQPALNRAVTVSIPNGLPRPFSLFKVPALHTHILVSIPN